MKRHALTGAVLAAALLAGCGSDDTGASSAGDLGTTTEIWNLAVHNDQFAAVDVGEPGRTVGDVSAFSDNLTKDSRDGEPIGHDGGTCQTVDVEGEQVQDLCILTISLPDGQLTAQALWIRGSSPLDMAITGGTGAYADASGWVTATDIATPDERYVVTITK